MVARAALETTPVIRSAGIGGCQIAPAHREHWAAAVTADEKPRVHVVVDLDPAIVICRAAFAQRAHSRKRAVVDDLLMVVLKDAVLALVQLAVCAVDFYAREFSLPQRADIKIVIQNALHRDDRPRRFRLAADRLSRGGAALTFGHPWRGHVVVRQIVGNFLVAPAV